jgi:hypothetical protein
MGSFFYYSLLLRAMLSTSSQVSFAYAGLIAGFFSWIPSMAHDISLLLAALNYQT